MRKHTSVYMSTCKCYEYPHPTTEPLEEGIHRQLIIKAFTLKQTCMPVWLQLKSGDLRPKARNINGWDVILRAVVVRTVRT